MGSLWIIDAVHPFDDSVSLYTTVPQFRARKVRQAKICLIRMFADLDRDLDYMQALATTRR